MKIECTKDRISWAVGIAEKVTSKNAPLKSLAGVYLKTNQNILSVRSTNLDLGVLINIPARVSAQGAVVVPAHVLGSLLGSLGKESSVGLTLDGQLLRIKSRSTETSIKILPLEDFPIIPELSDDEAFSMPSTDFVYGLRSVVYASATSSMKPELSSVSISYEDGGLVFVATDSFRLAEKKIKVKKMPHFKRILIPNKNVSEIIRILGNMEEEVSMTVEENQIAFRGGGVYLTSRVIEGTFPDYKQIIPKEVSTDVVVLKQDLVDALKTSLIFSDNLNQVHLDINPAKKLFEIRTKNVDVGENVCAVPSVLEGESISININHKYLVDGFPLIPTDSIRLAFSGTAKPVVVTGVGDKSFMYLTMPMNKS